MNTWFYIKYIGLGLLMVGAMGHILVGYNHKVLGLYILGGLLFISVKIREENEFRLISRLQRFDGGLGDPTNLSDWRIKRALRRERKWKMRKRK